MIELLLQAERALSVGLLDRAEILYRQVAAADPRNSIAVVGLARVALERGDEDGALELGRRALEIDPQNDAARRLVQRLEEVRAYRRESGQAPPRPPMSAPIAAAEPEAVPEPLSAPVAEAAREAEAPEPDAAPTPERAGEAEAQEPEAAPAPEAAVAPEPDVTTAPAAAPPPEPLPAPVPGQAREADVAAAPEAAAREAKTPAPAPAPPARRRSWLDRLLRRNR